MPSALDTGPYDGGQLVSVYWLVYTLATQPRPRELIIRHKYATIMHDPQNTNLRLPSGMVGEWKGQVALFQLIPIDMIYLALIDSGFGVPKSCTYL